MSDRVFLTDQRRDVLKGQYEGSDTALRTQKSRLRQASSTVLDELIAVADSGEIDNADTFDSEQVYHLLVALAIDRDTFASGDPDDPHHKQVDEEFKREVLEAVDDFRFTYHRGYGPGDEDEID